MLETRPHRRQDSRGADGRRKGLAQADRSEDFLDHSNGLREAGEDDLRNVPTAIKLSPKTLSKVKQNLFWAFGYNVVLIPVAAGVLVPFFGANRFARGIQQA